MTTRTHIAVGFLVFPPERLVMLHLRGPENDPDPNLWAAVGGHEEPEDQGDLRQTLCRELREELDLAVTTNEMQEVRQLVEDDGRQVAVYAIPMADTCQSFVVREGRGVGWFTIPEALALTNLAAVTRADLPRIAEWLDTTGT